MEHSTRDQIQPRIHLRYRPTAVTGWFYLIVTVGLAAAILFLVAKSGDWLSWLLAIPPLYGACRELILGYFANRIGELFVDSRGLGMMVQGWPSLSWRCEWRQVSGLAYYEHWYGTFLGLKCGTKAERRLRLEDWAATAAPVGQPAQNGRQSPLYRAVSGFRAVDPAGSEPLSESYTADLGDAVGRLAYSALGFMVLALILGFYGLGHRTLGMGTPDILLVLVAGMAFFFALRNLRLAQTPLSIKPFYRCLVRRHLHLPVHDRLSRGQLSRWYGSFGALRVGSCRRREGHRTGMETRFP